jgi:nitroimidazol reductase NimA-like FMN-containing flavoprotein (pyridoxamine 5'-phosphate oxidase superfamily)
MIRQMNAVKAEEMLKKGALGHLGCVLENGEPYVVPVNYIFSDGQIYIHSLPGQKLDALRAHRKACVQVEEIESSYRWQSVIAFGDFREVENTDEKTKVLREFYERFRQLTPVEAMHEEETGGQEAVVFRIDVKRITGVAEG